MPAVVLRGGANTAPDAIVGPFASIEAAERWAQQHPREGGYCVAEQLTPIGQAPESREGLGASPLMAFIPVNDIDVARTFYEATLGLAILEESPFALIVDANGTTLRITPVPDLRPQPFTIAGWEVDDIAGTIAVLVARGVTFNRYAGMEQQANGVWVAPGGDLVAWFIDPDGNTLSLTQFTR